MPYILKKTNGEILTIVNDASLNITTDLNFVGKNYSGYGPVLDENFLKLLENFANTSAPNRPVQGQLWFNNTIENRKLTVCYDGTNFKSLANLVIQVAPPSGATVGDLWWDTTNGQLNAFDGNQYQLIGPQNSSVTKASWAFETEVGSNDPTQTPYAVIKGEISNNPIVAISELGYTVPTGLIPQNTSNLYRNFSQGIRPGITIAGCDANGSSAASGFYFWGTASEALKAPTQVASTATDANFYITFTGQTDGTQPLYTTSSFYINPSTNVLNATATAAYYADLAERYAADAEYEVGTVLIIGGDKEVTISTLRCDLRVAGVVSGNPAFMMNKDAGTNATHPYLALKGRVPCKVVGPISKGDLLVTSTTAGCACRYQEGVDNSLGVVGKALEDFAGGNEPGMIEVKV